MSNELQAAPAAKPVSLLAKCATKFGVEPEKMLNTLRLTAFKGADVTNEQMMALLIVADQYNLNPWTKEIYAYPDKGGIVPVVGVDGWIRIINERPELDGIEFEYGERTGVNFDYIECVITRKDRAKPIKAREFWDEVAKGTVPWKSHPKRMHRHKALIQCARIAFGFAGIYDPEEAQAIIERNITPPANEAQQAEQKPMTTTEKIKAAARAKATENAQSVDAIDPDTGEIISAASDDHDAFVSAMEAEENRQRA